MRIDGAGVACLAFGLAMGFLGGCARPAPMRLSKDTYIDKCKGAWAGQMIGVCYGEPYQFQSNGRPVTAAMWVWKPEVVAGAVRQDDVYVELTFLAALEKHGLDITPERAGQAFAAAPYPLWHANLYGRENVRQGIAPPKSGQPQYNRHCDDIDFQIESDLFGILCPGLPRESNRLCDTFGHIMCYGDGVYGGMFVAGMYTAAFFEDSDVLKVIRAGLACIPEESQYHQCISDTVRWCLEEPDNWPAAWTRVERKWNDDLDCMPGNPHNIDAKINGAYIVIGLLYGRGDFLRTIEICTRCGQDADSSTANAGGLIGCMKGYHRIGDDVTGGIPATASEKFLGTAYSFNTLVPACVRMAETVIRRAGGRVTDDGYVIPRQAPVPARLEQWRDEAIMIHTAVTPHEVGLWNKAWRPVAVVSQFKGGFYPAAYGRENVLMINPITPDHPAAVEARLQVPSVPHPRLHIEVASDGQHGDFLMKAFINNRLVKDVVVDTGGEFVTEVVEMDPGPGLTVDVRLEFHAKDWSVNAAYIRQVGVK